MSVNFRMPTRQVFFVAMTIAVALSGCDEINGMKNEKAIHEIADKNNP